MNKTQKVQWPRIVAEATAIVASILLAFWIQAWWDDRIEQKEFLSYLQALEQEFIDARELFERNIEAYSHIENATDEVLLILADTSNEALPDSFEKSVGQMYTILYVVPAMGAYNDIVYSGNLRLIQVAALRSQLNQYIHETSVIKIGNQKIWDTYYDIHLSFLSKHFVISEFGWDTPSALINNSAINVGKETPPSPFEMDIAAVRSREFWNLAYDWKVGKTDEQVHIIRARAQCDEILKLLRIEIGLIGS